MKRFILLKEPNTKNLTAKVIPFRVGKSSRFIKLSAQIVEQDAKVAAQEYIVDLNRPSFTRWQAAKTEMSV